MVNFFLNFSVEILLLFFTLVTLGLNYSDRKEWSSKPEVAIQIASELGAIFAVFLLLLLPLFYAEFCFYLQAEEIAFYTNKDFSSTPFLLFSKIFTVILTSFCLALASKAIKYSNYTRIEYPFFYLTALLAMLFLISSNNLLYIYLALELLNFSLYLIVGGKVFSSLANEASQRYFVYSSYASALFLLGSALLFGLFGTLNLEELGELFLANQGILLFTKELLRGLALILLLVGVLFKLAIFPFHFWVPEVYEGSALSSVLFLSTAPKVAVLSLLLKLLYGLAFQIAFFLPLLQLLAFLSIGYGIIAGLYEYRLKRFLGYSAISNMGFILFAFSLHSLPGTTAGMLYLFVYMITNLGFFGVFLLFLLETNLGKEDLTLESLELKQIFSLAFFRSYPAYVFTFAILILSFAGIPPLAGFFVKFHLFQASLQAQNFLVTFLIFLFSVLSLGFYLRLLRFLFVTPLVATFEYRKGFPGLVLVLKERPVLAFCLLSLILVFLVTYGFFFQQALNLFFTTVALFSFPHLPGPFPS